MRIWIVSCVMFLDAACISNLYWLGVTVHDVFFVPAVVLSILTGVAFVASLIAVLE